MTSRKRWREIQQAMSEIESEEDIEEVRRMIRELDEEDQDRADLAHQLARVESGFEHMGGINDG